MAARPARVTFDVWSGVSTGVIAGLLSPPVVRVIAERMGAPEWSDLATRGTLILAPLAVYAVLRPRGRYALGMAAGATAIGVLAPLALMTLVVLVDSVEGWI